MPAENASDPPAEMPASGPSQAPGPLIEASNAAETPVPQDVQPAGGGSAWSAHSPPGSRQSRPPPPRPRAPPPPESRARPPSPGQIRPTNGKSAKLPSPLLPGEVQALLETERREALAVRDPIAIALAAERFNTLATILAEFSPQESVDLYRPLLTVSQTAKMLGYNAKEVRRLLGQGKIAGRKVGNEWRIPLWAVL